MGETIKVGDSVTIDGSTYPVKYVTGSHRVLIDMGMNTLVGADFTSEGWELSGEPMSPEETAFLESQPDFGKTEVVVTKNE